MDNLTMALNQAQFIIAKSSEIEMLKNIKQRVTNWEKNSLTASQRQCEDRVITLLKTGLHLIEDIPSCGSYAEFKQLAEYLSDDTNESFDIFYLKAVDRDEKMSLIKKFIREMCMETPLPEGMQQIAFGENSVRISSGAHTVDKTSDVGDYSSVPRKHQDSGFSNRDTNEVSPSGENHMMQKEPPVVSKVPLAQPMLDVIPSPKEKPQVVASATKTSAYFSPQFQSLWSRNSTIKTPLLEKVSQKPLTRPKARAQKEDNLSAGRRSFDQLDKKSVMVEPNAHLGEESENMRIAARSVGGSRESYFGRNDNDLRNSNRGRNHDQFQQESLTSPRVPLDSEENVAKEEMSTSYFSDYDYVSIPNHTSQASSTIGNQQFTASERFESEVNHVSSRSSSSDRERAPYPSANESSEESAFRGAAPIMPWYYQRLDQGNLWRQRSSETQEPGRASESGSLSRSNPNRQSIRSFLFNGNSEQNTRNKKLPLNGTKAEVVPTTPPIVLPSGDDRSVSRDGSISSISPFRPYDDNVSNGNLRSLSPVAKPHRSRSTSETSDVAVVGVRERVIEIQQRSAAVSPSVVAKQHFPPLSLIPQLRQQKSESTIDWLERLEGQLKQYMEPSCREYDVILRWILSCGSRQEGSYAVISLQASVEDIVSRLTAHDTINDSRGVLPQQPLREDGYFNSNKINVHSASSGSKTYRPSIRKWRYGVRDRNSTVSSASADIPWHWVDVEYVLEASEHLVKLEDAEKHLSGGRARKVVVIGDTVDIPIIFYPISYRKYQRGCSIISAGSADALAFATLLYLLDKELGIIEGIATLMTGFSSNQRIVDGPVSDEWRLGRGAVQSIIPYNLKRVLHTILQSMPDMAGKILITGCSVPVDSGSAVDFTCRLSRPVASARELADILRESNTLKTLEAIHMKCQPGWLLSHWCPEIPELKKSDLPKVECAVNPNTTNHSNVQEISAPLGDEVWFAAKRETKVKEVTTLEPLPQKFVEPASDVVHFWQDEADCCVGRDILSSGCMVTLDVHSSLSITDGSLMKLIAWYDRDMSFCKRILDLLVYMRYVDHS
ncbi:hypothetical protein TcWFU_001756 [Taenia crassiceps]|uniref:Glyceraldehyde 3-phosphate dehydrogenase catalytic domain-containing protein n=1 Tax=Taenia crassiceps TaxID=6207 RepID=A0ABR4QCP0_9CEST